ncbi:hypothetical protein ADUPG1_012955 [Aduncisulcus paluster]|uniref:Uncharacterized protein n=1 Tax=Aduncisulcus paluster TaxID=2918883 RepID=A0ABQ5K1W0_9EUKA|nr:hypothetical protein ADUPG1_012955 [Aduncisulcus paluster]
MVFIISYKFGHFRQWDDISRVELLSYNDSLSLVSNRSFETIFHAQTILQQFDSELPKIPIVKTSQNEFYLGISPSKDILLLISLGISLSGTLSGSKLKDWLSAVGLKIENIYSSLNSVSILPPDISLPPIDQMRTTICFFLKFSSVSTNFNFQTFIPPDSNMSSLSPLLELIISGKLTKSVLRQLYEIAGPSRLLRLPSQKEIEKAFKRNVSIERVMCVHGTKVVDEAKAVIEITEEEEERLAARLAILSETRERESEEVEISRELTREERARERERKQKEREEKEERDLSPENDIPTEYQRAYGKILTKQLVLPPDITIAEVGETVIPIFYCDNYKKIEYDISEIDFLETE